MKHILFLLFLVPAISYGQQQWSNNPVKKCNKICITTSDSPDVAFKKLVISLAQYGYGIDTKDADLLMVSTKSKGYHAVNTELNAYVTKDGDSTKTYITGNYTTVSIDFYGSGLSSNSTNLKSVIDFRGMDKSPANDAWKEMYNVAQSIPGNKSYLKP